jgi:hypothetical protein
MGLARKLVQKTLSEDGDMSLKLAVEVHTWQDVAND